MRLCPGAPISVSTVFFGSATLWIIIWMAATRSRLPNKRGELLLLPGAIVPHLGRMTLYDLCISRGGHCRRTLGGEISCLKSFALWISLELPVAFSSHEPPPPPLSRSLKKHNVRLIVGSSQFFMKSTNSIQPWSSRHLIFKEIKSSHRLGLGYDIVRNRFSSFGQTDVTRNSATQVKFLHGFYVTAIAKEILVTFESEIKIWVSLARTHTALLGAKLSCLPTQITNQSIAWQQLSAFRHVLYTWWRRLVAVWTEHQNGE